MSRIGSKTITPKRCHCRSEAGVVHVKGAKGELTYVLLRNRCRSGGTTVKGCPETQECRHLSARHGLTASRHLNMVKGIGRSRKKLEIIRWVTKAQIKGKVLVLSLGYSHVISGFAIPAGIRNPSGQRTSHSSLSADDKHLW